MAVIARAAKQSMGGDWIAASPAASRNDDSRIAASRHGAAMTDFR
jgi:hypothetical protein